MDFIDKQIAPPRSWEKFEELTRALFARVRRDPLTQKNGRAGQKQHGVDVYGSPLDAPATFFGVQCKGKDGAYGAKATNAEFDTELAKAEKFTPFLAHWTFATTAPNDAALQRHAREVSQRRVGAGKFPVVVIGWETIQGLLTDHADVIEQFYPEHSGDLPAILSSLRALPSAGDLEIIKVALTNVAGSISSREPAMWSEVRFETARDLGPALMGRPLGPADVSACPVLPETAELLADLKRAGTARLAGVAGAGKSICILQAASQLHTVGWKILRLEDPKSESIPPVVANRPTLLIVDDAHLARASFLRGLEEQATGTRWILTAHTIAEGRENMPGTIQLDAKRAVRVIADGLRAAPDATLEVVRRADDRVGDRPGDEQLDYRLEHAADVAQFPWQFCFILGGGWRRATAMASSARAAGADLVLAAAAIRQLSTRDGRCSPDALRQLIGKSLPSRDCERATDWLIGQRLLLAGDDLRCPHQRLASVLLMKVLDGQNAAGRETIATVIQQILIDPETPLGGIAVLLGELSRGADFGKWRSLVQRSWLDPVLQRCWIASAADDIRDACLALIEIKDYAADERTVFTDHQQVIVRWLSSAPDRACYPLGRLINHIHNESEALGHAISVEVDPALLANAISASQPLHACEVASLILSMRVANDESWKRVYLGQIDRTALINMVANWPQDAWLSAVADLCKHFCYLEDEFGFQLIEALIPAIAVRMREDPQYSFNELNDIVWHSLRLYDPLEVYKGKNAPTVRMKEVGRKLSASWSANDLASKLSQSTPRTFQAAAGILSFIRKASPRLFKSTVLALDWNMIDQQIGADWTDGIGDARMLLGVACALPEARPAIEELVARNEGRIKTMSAHLAAIAPKSAFRHVAAGKPIAISYSGHVEWKLGLVVLIHFIEAKRELSNTLIEPHLLAMATALSQPSPTFYSEALLFLRIADAVIPDFFSMLLSLIDTEKAAIGWRHALLERENNRVPGAKAQARQVAALLINRAIDRKDKVGELARDLRKAFPRASMPHRKTVEPIELP